MPARLIQVGRGSYKVRWRDGTRLPNGRYVERSTGVMDRAAALSEKRRLDTEQKKRRDLKRGLVPGRLATLESLLASWGRWALANDVARAPHVEEVQAILGGLFDRRGWATVHDVTAAAVAAWREEGGGKGTDKPLSLLKSVLRYARSVLKQPIDPDVLTVPGRRGRRRTAQPPLLTREQVGDIIARARAQGGEDCAAILEHLSTYGCRPIDACRLRVADFNAVTGEITLRETKNGDTVTHPLLPAHVERYRKMIDGRRPADALFQNPKREAWEVKKSAQQLNDWYVNNVSSYLLKRQQWGLYLLKDYAITAMDVAGVDDRTKTLFTGHRSLQVFERYKATNKQRAKAALDKIAAPVAVAASAASAPQVRPEAQSDPA